MAQRGKQSFEKRQRESDRKDRARQKEARRQERKDAEDDEGGDAVDEAALMGQYGRLAERHANGEIDDERFAERKREIFEALGLDVD